MSAVWAHTRAGLRRRWKSWLALTVFVALAGGSVLAMVAGARRTDTAYPRFLKAVRAPDVVVYLGGGRSQIEPVTHLPEVAQAATATGLFPADLDIVTVALDDPRLGQSVSRFKFLAGRAPRAADEVLVSFEAARQRHLKVGSPLTVHFLVGGAGSGAVEAVTFHVVGIEAAAGEFPPHTSPFISNPVYVSRAFLDTPAGIAAAGPQPIVAVVLRLKQGSAYAFTALSDTIRALNAPTGVTLVGQQSALVQRSMHQQALALWLMAAFAALAVTLILSQLVVRQLSEEDRDVATLRALGMTSGQLASTTLLQLATTSVIATAGAVAVALLASPLLPLGTARIAEPRTGFRFDAPVAGAGGFAIIAILAALGFAAVFLKRRPEPLPAASEEVDARRRTLAAWLSGLPLPLVVTTGVRLALQRGRARTAVPVRATLIAAAVGIAAVVAALTFADSLGHLLSTPRLYGVTFDADLEPQGNFADVRPLLPAVERDPTVAAATVGWTAIPMSSGGVVFGGQAMETPGVADPTVTSGRLPFSADEILLGIHTARSLHARVGVTVHVTVANVTNPIPMRVVGLGILPSFSVAEQLGRGAVFAPAAIGRFTAAAPKDFPFPPPGDIAVRFRPGVDRARALADLSRSVGGVSVAGVAAAPQPEDVANFGQVTRLPQVLAGMLAVMAAAATANLLVGSVRRRRRDLAVFKTIGLVPRQLGAVIAWQATTVAVIALVAGVPVGLAAGRWLWTLVARSVGVIVQPVVPWPFIALVIPATAVIVNVVAAGPAVAAGHIRTAPALRAE